MSNVIPFVSSSPPPMDDDEAAFKWDDDDDEYGNFASAASVSATTLASDASMTANWSTSETSVSAEDAPNNKSPIKSDSKASCDERSFNISNSNCNRSENISSSILNSHIVLPQVQSQSNDCDENNDFQDFANFGSAEFSHSPMKHVSKEKTESKPSPQDASLSPTQNGTSDDANASEEDEFEEFAQFNDAAITENLEHSSVKPELDEVPRDVNKTNSSNVSEDHCFQDAQSSIPNHGLEPVVTDIESVSCVHTQNNESIYSSASTVDSGMFSADMSPSCHPGDLSQTCLYSEKEESIPDNHAVTETSSIPTSSSLSFGQSHESINLQDASAENYSKSVTSFDTVVIDNKNSCEDFIVSDSSSCEGNGGINISSQDRGFIGSNMPGSCDNVNEEGSFGRFSDSEENTIEGGLCKTSNEVSTKEQRIEISSHSSSSTTIKHEVGNIESKAGFLTSPCVIQEEVDIHSGPLDLGSSKIHDCNAESFGENVFLAQENKVQKCEFKAADSETDNGNIVELNERSTQNRGDESGHGGSAEWGGDKCDKHRDLVCEGDSSTKDKVDYATSEDNFHAGDFDEHVGNCDISVHDISSVPVTGLPDSTQALKDVENCTEDEEEFGEFGISVGQTDAADDDDSNEVAPITFRTSVCELAADEGENDGDFTFDRERPPVLEDEGDSSSHEARGRGSKDISDGEDMDDFGEFDSAQNVQPSNSSASIYKSDGDFGRQQAAGDDGAGWADFGSAVTPAVSESISSSTVKQTSAAARPEQSKAQKLRLAVVSCFPDFSLQASFDYSQVESVQSDGQEEQPLHGDNGTSPAKNDEGPLPLDTVVDLGLSNALEAKQQTWTVVQHPAKKDPKVRLWSHLKDVDSCHALMYSWHTSHCSKEVFATLHIDTQNILFTHKKQAVPFFASGLGILEPIRGGGAAQDRKKDKSNIPATKTTLLETGRQDNHLSPATQDIPPVDFDWSSSGLTNPLTANTLDLDFLVIQGSDSYEKTSDEWDWVFKTDNQNLTPSALQPLEEILKKTTPTVKLSTNEVWSPEAVRVLEKMPDLSFMQSRVLMFPVKQ